MKSLYELAEEANSYTAGWMSRQPALREESITDWLLDFFDQNSSLIQYYQFNHSEEARSGADWDWWFLLRKGCFKIRVQAKKVRKNYNHYRDLAHSNKKGKQLDILLNSSANYNFYPLYSLYGFSENVERCRIPSYRFPSNKNCLFICSAQEVYDLVFSSSQKRIGSSALLKLSIPLQCLFCHFLITESDFFKLSIPLQCLFCHHRSVIDNFSDGFPILFQSFFSPPLARDAEDGAEPEGQRGYEDEVPSIIRALFEAREDTGGDIQERRNTENIQEILSQYQHDFAGANGVAIVQAEQTR